MAGIELQEAILGFNGLAGDRRFGIQRLGDKGGFPWVSASKLPELLLYEPGELNESDFEPIPQKIRTPKGRVLDVFDAGLDVEISGKLGFDVEMTKIKQGIFDDSPLSIITTSTIGLVCDQAGIEADARRFRANLVVEMEDSKPFGEDSWVGKMIRIGQTAAVFATKRDIRCKMIGIDPDTANYDPSLLKTVVDLNDNNAGVYCTVLSPGKLHVGDELFVADSL